MTLDPSLERCEGVRIALGAVAPTTIRARAAERSLEGHLDGEGRRAQRAGVGCRAEDLLAQHPTRFSNAAELAGADRIH